MNTSLFLIACVMAAMGASNGESPRSASGGIVPHKSFIILSRAAWGCLRGQQVVEEVSGLLAQDDADYATIHEIKNPEDVANRYELYLLFPGAPVNGLPGYFVVQFWCDNDKPEVKAFLSLNHARLYGKEDQWLVSLKLKGNGFVHGRMFYSRKPELRQAWFSCPEAGAYQPYQVTFFSAYPLEGRPGGMPQEKLNGEWQSLELQIDGSTLDEAINVDRCQAFLDVLDKHFAEPDRPLVWKRQNIRPDSIRELFKGFETACQGEPFQFLLKVDDRTAIQLGPDNFVPHLRQKLTVTDADGKLVGAELSIFAR